MLFSGLKKLYQNQKAFISSLPKSCAFVFALVLLTHFASGMYYSINVPLHYDEWYSLRHFSGTSFGNIFTNYFVPNNHILFNAVVRLFLLTGIDAEIAVRLPVCLASLFTVYYLFKTATFISSAYVANIVIVLFLSLPNVLLYSFLARGYGFQNLFTVMLFYSAFGLIQKFTKRHLFLFLIFQVCGIYTIPTFIYLLIPVNIFMFVYFLRKGLRNPLRYLFFGVLGAALLTILLYGVVLLNTDFEQMMLSMNGSEPFSLRENGAFEHLLNYVNTTAFSLFGFTRPGVLLSLGSCSLFALYRLLTSGQFIFGLLCFVVFVSPLLILPMHSNLPFGRNWLYIAPSFCLFFGLIVHVILLIVQKTTIGKFFDLFMTVGIFTALVLQIHTCIQFPKWHRREYQLDYQLAFFRKHMLRDCLSKINTIGVTSGYYDFYAAEVVQNFCEKDKKEKVTLNVMNGPPKEDLLLIGGSAIDDLLPHLSNYRILYFESNIRFYAKK